MYSELIKDVTAETNERSRLERTGLLLKRLQERNALPLLFSLIENTLDKHETNNISAQLLQQTDNINKLLINGIAPYLPSQSGGIPIAKATFNYYTINKKPVDYNQKIKEQLGKLKVNIDVKSIMAIAKHSNLSKSIQLAIMNDINRVVQQNSVLLLGDIPPTITLNYDYASLRQILKNIKANQKKKFNEMMTKEDFTFKGLKNNQELYLFNTITTEELFTEYKQKTQEIEKIATQINQSKSDDVKKKSSKSKRKDCQRTW